MMWAVDCHLCRKNWSHIDGVTKFMREPRGRWDPGVPPYGSYDHFMSMRIVALIMDKLFIWAPKIYEESILQPWFGFANHFALIVCSHPWRSGLFGISNHLRPIYLVIWPFLPSRATRIFCRAAMTGTILKGMVWSWRVKKERRPRSGSHRRATRIVINVQDWSPHMSFIFKGPQISAFQLKGWFKSKTCQSKNIGMKYKTHIKLVHELYDTCFQYNVKNYESTI